MRCLLHKERLRLHGVRSSQEVHAVFLRQDRGDGVVDFEFFEHSTESARTISHVS